MENIFKLLYSDELDDVTRKHPKLSVFNDYFGGEPMIIPVLEAPNDETYQSAYSALNDYIIDKRSNYHSSKNMASHYQDYYTNRVDIYIDPKIEFVKKA